jgi:twitching motility protein PilT
VNRPTWWSLARCATSKPSRSPCKHTNSASKAADRIIDVFSEESREQIRGVVSVMLRGVVAQMLVKRSSGEGRQAALEIMLQTVGISNLIRENKCYQIDSYLQTADPGSGMQSLDSCLFQYIRDGVVTVEEALRVANFPDVLKRMAAELPEDE